MSRRQALYTMRSQPYLTPQLQHPAPLLSHQKYLHHSQGDRDVPRRYQGQLCHQTTTVTFVWEMCTRTRKLDSLRSCCLVLTVEDQVDVTLWCQFFVFFWCHIYVAFIFVAAACLWARCSHYIMEKPASTPLAHDAIE